MQNRINFLYERIRKYKMGIYTSNQEIEKLNKQIAFEKKKGTR